MKIAAWFLLGVALGFAWGELAGRLLERGRVRTFQPFGVPPLVVFPEAVQEARL